VFALSPNQTPFRDQFFLEKLTGINPSSKVDVGKIFFNLFNIMGESTMRRCSPQSGSSFCFAVPIMDALCNSPERLKPAVKISTSGVYPALYAALLLPAGKSSNKVSMHLCCTYLGSMSSKMNLKRMQREKLIPRQRISAGASRAVPCTLFRRGHFRPAAILCAVDAAPRGRAGAAAEE